MIRARLPLRRALWPAASNATTHRISGLSASKLRYASTSTSPRTFNSLTEDDIAHFSKFLPSSSILTTLGPNTSTTTDDLDAFNGDWMNKYKGTSQCVVKPRTTEEVSKILKWCNERNIAVVPQGGNTGLVGKSYETKRCAHCWPHIYNFTSRRRSPRPR